MAAVVHRTNKARFCQNRPVMKTPTALWDHQSMSKNDSSSNESDGVECPTCGGEFSNEHGMKIHHSKAHGASIAGRELACEWCGESYRVLPARVNESKYCSTECRGNGHSSNMSGEDHPDWKERESVECEWCGESYSVLPSKVSGTRFCSRECKHQSDSVRMSGENNPSWKGNYPTIECGWCGEDYTVIPAKENSSKYCSKECKDKAHSINMTGENHPRWKGGTTHIGYGSNWSKQRKRCLERDGYRCRICGMDDETHREKYVRGLDVHHIIPRVEFTEPGTHTPSEEANKLDNLVTLCREHHAEWEGVPIFPLDRRGET